MFAARSAIPARGAPSATPAAIAARAFSRLCASAKGKWKAWRPAGVSISASVTPSATLLSTAKTSPPGPKRSSRGASPRCGSSSPASTGAIAVPSGGSAASTSAFAAAIASTEPSSSTWTGPTLVITATSGSAIAASSAICPAPRIAISSTRTSVSSGASSTRQRQPDLGVEVLAVGVDPAGQQRPGDVLDRGLADRAGDADDAGAERAPPGAGERLQRGQRIGDGEDPGPHARR